MKYYVVDLKEPLAYHFSGRSVDPLPRIHLSRTLADYELFFVTDGVLPLKQEDEHDVHTGEIVLHEKNQPQAGARYAVNSFYWLHVDGAIRSYQTEEQARRDCENDPNKIWFDSHFRLVDPDRITVFLTQINHYAFEGGDKMVKSYLCCALFAELARQYQSERNAAQYDRRFLEILSFLSLHIDSDLSVSALAERFFYNPKYLSRLFVKRTGKTAAQFITEKRIEKAQNLLVSTTESVKQIALTVGFRDEYYFMKAFKKKTGLTPKQYRKTFSACLYT